jgi:uncharacterized membrane protein
MMKEDETTEDPRRGIDSAPAEAPPIIAESRWPMATAVAVAVALQFCKPAWLLVGFQWVLPIVWSGLLVAVILADPGRIDSRSRGLRILSIILVILVALNSLGSTIALTMELVWGAPNTNSAGSLLAAGTIVWIDNCIAFSLLYWTLDSGGSAARAHRMPQYPDFAFPQTLTPALAPPDWRPRFVDYLYLGFTNATAFSPTDVMPLVPWAKILMVVQSIVSLVILVLVVARAVNVFT